MHLKEFFRPYIFRRNHFINIIHKWRDISPQFFIVVCHKLQYHFCTRNLYILLNKGINYEIREIMKVEPTKD